MRKDSTKVFMEMMNMKNMRTLQKVRLNIHIF